MRQQALEPWPAGWAATSTARGSQAHRARPGTARAAPGPSPAVHRRRPPRRRNARPPVDASSPAEFCQPAQASARVAERRDSRRDGQSRVRAAVPHAVPGRPRARDSLWMPKRVGQAFEHPPRHDRFVRQRQQADAQRQQVTGEVSAVDGRDVHRQQRLQGLRVVPVVEVTPVPFEGAMLRSALAVRSSSVRSEGSRSHGRPGWRAAPAPCWSARCGAPPPGRVAPGRCPAAASCPPGRRTSRRTPRFAARAARRKTSCCVRQAGLRTDQRPAQPPGDARRDQPQQQDRRCERQHRRAAPAPGTRRPRVRSPASSTSTGVIASNPGSLPLPASPGRAPFQQPLARDQYAPGRAQHRIGAAAGFVRQAGQCKSRLRPLRGGRAQGRSQVLAQRRVSWLAQQLQHRAEQRRHQRRCRRATRVQASAEGSAIQRGQQQQQQRNRHQAAPQVVGNLPAATGRTAGCGTAAPRRPAPAAAASWRSASRRGSSGAGERCPPQ